MNGGALATLATVLRCGDGRPSEERIRRHAERIDCWNKWSEFADEDRELDREFWPIEQRVCAREGCGQLFKPYQFTRNRFCSTRCSSEEWERQNKEKMSAHRTRWNKANAAYFREYRRKNRDKLREYQRAWRERKRKEARA